MIKIFLVVYNASGLMIDTLATPSLGKCMELSARMKMLDFSIPTSERFHYDCKPMSRKLTITAMQ